VRIVGRTTPQDSAFNTPDKAAAIGGGELSRTLTRIIQKEFEPQMDTDKKLN